MFKNHPKGLYVLSLANTGERFGFYTTLTIFTLYIQARFGFDEAQTSTIYGVFLAASYFTPLIGGALADRYGYNKMVIYGFITMLIGYVLLAIPSTNVKLCLILMFTSLTFKAVGTGLFKGNLQVLLGNLYNSSKISGLRDKAFSIFYMAINVGALFAPAAATVGIDYVMRRYGFTYNPSISALANQFVDNTITPTGLENLVKLQAEQNFIGETSQFCIEYLNVISRSYNLGFAIACASIILSMIIYLGFKKYYLADATAEVQSAEDKAKEELSPKEIKSRMTSLFFVFAVVIFFWMAFQQNGLTLTFFARDYTAKSVSGIEQMPFSLLNIVMIIAAVYSVVALLQSSKLKGKVISLSVGVVAVAVLIYQYIMQPTSMPISPELFQQFNPLFVVILTPVALGVFSMLAKRGKEPSEPRKIGYGMILGGVAFMILMVGSIGLISPAELKTIGVSPILVSPNWLISTYLVLTFAELLLSPIGISFVSRVAPQKYKGAMVGAWFASSAIGNYLVAIIGYLWGDMPLWSVWGVLVACCLLSAGIMFIFMKRIERSTK